MRRRISVRVMLGLVAACAVGLGWARSWVAEWSRCPQCRDYDARVEMARRMQVENPSIRCIMFEDSEHWMFDWLIRSQIESYRAREGVFPSEWHQFNATFSGAGFYPIGVDVRASKQSGATWRPYMSKTTYVITEANESSCTIEGRDCLGTVLHTWRFAAGG